MSDRADEQATDTATRLRAAIEHTRLGAATTSAQIVQLCQEARDAGLFGVCVAPVHVRSARAALGGLGEGAGPALVTVVGFPLGASRSDVKAFECAAAVRDGATEVDMVIDLGALHAGQDDRVAADVAAVVAAADGRPVKVIIETSLLDDAQKRRACVASEAGGAAFVKTSTGFGGGGATVDDVVLMRSVVGPRLRIKASGGIRTRALALALLDAGADRLGTSAGVALLKPGG